MRKPSNNIEVTAQVQYLKEASNLKRHYHVFAYTITIRNQGAQGAQLLTRHWYITNANGEVNEVKGEGVVGEKPYLKPGEQFVYVSYAIINTPVGSMHGSYQLLADDGVGFEAKIPAFSLAIPSLIH